MSYNSLNQLKEKDGILEEHYFIFYYLLPVVVNEDFPCHIFFFSFTAILSHVALRVHSIVYNDNRQV